MDAGTGAAKGSSKGKTSGGTSSVDAAEESESESESSSSSSLPEGQRRRNPSEELESFRLQWKAELKKRTSGSARKENKNANRANVGSSSPAEASGDAEEDDSPSVSVEEQAKHWFLQGVGLERKGELYDAVRCYRRAIQLVPDIEYRVSVSGAPNASNSPSSSEGSPNDSEDEQDNEDDGENDEGPLTVKFLKIIEANGWNFFQKYKEDNKTHLNDLPVELLSYIMRWVVSNDLDVRSLDVLSNTCRGFYCVCRDEKLWEMACEKVWTDLNDPENENVYPSFREMFLKRPRVRFEGCYICKVSYIRPGEHSFQDQSYRPWHFVEYYRLIRFLSNGEILFLTTSDDPAASVQGLRDAKYPRNSSTMRGHYQLYGNNTVSAVVKKPTSTSNQTPVHRGRNAKTQTQDVTTFHLEFEICPVRNRANWMLKWSRYAVYISRCPINSNNKILNLNQVNNNPTVTSTTFDLNPNKFPPLLFSRVKSYNQKSEGIL